LFDWSAQGSKRVERFVYLIDDDDLILETLTLQLGRAGYNTRSYTDPRLFLDEAPQLPSGCIVLDLQMPVMTGLEVQESLVKMETHFPIIFYSGAGSIRHAVDGMRHGAKDFLQKGNVEGLLRALKEAFRTLPAAAA